MKHLTNAIEIIRDCCTRREPLEESKYNQLISLLPLHEQIEKHEKLKIFENEVEDETNIKKNCELLNLNLKKTESDSNNTYSLIEKVKIKDILKTEELYNSNKDSREEKVYNNKLLNGHLNKKHVKQGSNTTLEQKN